MKLVGIMSVQEDRPRIRDLMKRHAVQIYSETPITGHTTQTVEKFGWFATPEESPSYGTLAFAIIDDHAAQAIVAAIIEQGAKEPSDHPIRAFLVPVETMV
jgi:hypothetical protein